MFDALISPDDLEAALHENRNFDLNGMGLEGNIFANEGSWEGIAEDRRRVTFEFKGNRGVEVEDVDDD